MKKYLMVTLLSASIFASEWKVVYDGKTDNTQYLVGSFKEANKYVLEGMTGSSSSLGGSVIRETRINCKDKTIGYGEVTLTTNGGDKQKYYWAKNGWHFLPL
ncbi:MAG: hypothetical protein PHX13_04455 [Thiovulaceae bacterium]|nr:hypothetical protein [Sulfurimonadaceae bacterium]